ncbi:MAG: TetR/AcrR family transcriptional regulator [Pseudomonadota bacterium]
MAGQTRKQGPKRSEESRAAILLATREEMAENGWRKFSVDSVAKRARASKQTIYKWWPSVGTMCVEAGLELIPAASQTGRDPAERIGELFQPIEAAVRAGQGHAIIRASLIAAADDAEAGEVWRAWLNETMRAPLRMLLAELTAKRVVRRDWDIDTAMDLMVGPLWHRLVFMRAPIGEGFCHAQARLVLSVFTDG